ncbi:MAG: GxxExxY protein [Acidobacteria bacterium]|nr:MAG: GxxExxY protein [Acidobacteriota bacterium]REK02891.1 MAG: GxxExxY protein [Acidobacteriota bacterium]REK13305.1 MAG: GxxExxY protein [Acidobacteriota bacterium]REK41299.1 MAG: GxxExxY protein [Acidobacteriota bacterium]
MHENAIAKIVVDSAFKIHTTYGPGLLESIYEKLLEYELRQRGLNVSAQVPVPMFHEEIPLGIGFRADLIVNKKLVVEIKSVEAIAPVHLKQLRTYLMLTEKKLGLLINFNEALIKDGIRRVVNGL